VSNSFSYQNNFKIAFKSEELDFFDPELSEEYDIDNLIYLSKDTIRLGKNPLIQDRARIDAWITQDQS
jgi:hypothetical protein